MNSHTIIPINLTLKNDMQIIYKYVSAEQVQIYRKSGTHTHAFIHVKSCKALEI